MQHAQNDHGLKIYEEIDELDLLGMDGTDLGDRTGATVATSSLPPLNGHHQHHHQHHPPHHLSGKTTFAGLSSQALLNGQPASAAPAVASNCSNLSPSVQSMAAVMASAGLNLTPTQLELLRTQSNNFSMQSILQAVAAANVSQQQRHSHGTRASGASSSARATTATATSQSTVSSVPSHSAELFGLPSTNKQQSGLFGSAASVTELSSAKRPPYSATSSSSSATSALNTTLSHFNLFDPFEIYSSRFRQLTGSNATSLINAVTNTVNSTSPGALSRNNNIGNSSNNKVNSVSPSSGLVLSPTTLNNNNKNNNRLPSPTSTKNGLNQQLPFTSATKLNLQNGSSSATIASAITEEEESPKIKVRKCLFFLKTD